MIGKSKTRDTIRGLANYMEQEEKMAWRETRNLPGVHREQDIRLMEETASLSNRVEEPAYHMSISYAIKDSPTKEMMLEDADQVLQKMGLSDHQAVIVAHKDEAYKHLHIMVNRIHQDKSRAWSMWNDRDKYRPIFREIEKQRGYEQVSDLNWGKGNSLTNGEIHQLKESEAMPLAVKAKKYDFEGMFESSWNWEKLEKELKKVGCRIKTKGRGGVIEDRKTGQQMKLSRVGKAEEHSFGQLQKKFGYTFKEYQDKKRQQMKEQAKKRESERRSKISSHLGDYDIYRDLEEGLEKKRSWDKLDRWLGDKFRITLHDGDAVILNNETHHCCTLSAWGENRLEKLEEKFGQSLAEWDGNKGFTKALEKKLGGLSFGAGFSASKVKRHMREFLEAHEHSDQVNTDAKSELKNYLNKLLKTKSQAEKVTELFQSLSKLSGPMSKAASVGESISDQILGNLIAQEKSRGRGKGKGGGMDGI